LNVRVNVPRVSGPYGDERTDEKGSEKERGSAEMHSVNEDGIVPDPDLDPVELDIAFRFAAWSSVALVCVLSPLVLIPISNDFMLFRLLSCSF